MLFYRCSLNLANITPNDPLVISAGMDLFGGDPLGKFKVTKPGIHQIGRKIANLGMRSLICMEGGYNNSALGENIVAFLEAFQ